MHLMTLKLATISLFVAAVCGSTAVAVDYSRTDYDVGSGPVWLCAAVGDRGFFPVGRGQANLPILSILL